MEHQMISVTLKVIELELIILKWYFEWKFKR